MSQFVSEVADRRDADDRRGAAQYDVWWNFIIYMYTYSRSFLIQIFICAHTNTFSWGSSESTLDERYLWLLSLKLLINYTISVKYRWRENIKDILLVFNYRMTERKKEKTRNWISQESWKDGEPWLNAVHVWLGNRAYEIRFLLLE